MLTFTKSLVSRNRWLIAVPIVAAMLLLTTWLSRPAESAPAGAARAGAEQVGTVAYDDLGDGQKTKMPLNSFDWQIDMAKPVGGGGTGKPIFSDPTIVQDSAPASALIMKTIATGRHIKTITVVLFRTGTTTPAQRWVFSDVMLLQDRPSFKSTPPSGEAVTFMYKKVTETSFAADGTTVVQSYCYDTATKEQCA